jgi:hypothetical protein
MPGSGQAVAELNNFVPTLKRSITLRNNVIQCKEVT